VGISQETFHCRQAETGEILPYSAGNEQSPQQGKATAESKFSPKTPARGVGASQGGEIPESARYEHDNKKREKTGGYPPSGQKNPEQPGPILSAPRQEVCREVLSGDRTNTENSSWNCACI
jgi:hypothetical protein